MASFPSSPIVTLAATDSRTADGLSFVFNARPQALTIYMRFVELGAINQSSVALVAIPGGASAPRLQVVPSSGNYSILWHTASGTVTSTLSSGPSYGDLVELVGTLTAAGVVQIGQSINGGAITTATASSALALPPAWASATLSLTAGSPHWGVRNLRIDRGVFDMPTMRRKAGV